MSRKRLTQIAPFLLPIRLWQRSFCYHLKMKFDQNKYAKRMEEPLEYEVCSSKTWMLNEQSGYDIIYQKNKIENLKIASKTMNHITIYPGETFSFCYLIQNSKKYGTYKDGLVLVDGKIVKEKGGGLCQLSNLLYHLFLMSPLQIVERHPHQVKSLPDTDMNAIQGVDATIYNGWLDLKVKNETNEKYQIELSFDENYMYGVIRSNVDKNQKYEIQNENLKYVKENGNIYECVDVVRIITHQKKETKKEVLYKEKVLIGYQLPKEIEIKEDTTC